MLEPHGVIGVAASFRYRQYFSSDDSIIAVLETASPSKFPDFQKNYPDIPIPQCLSLKKLAGIDLSQMRPGRVAAEPAAIVEQLESITGNA